MKDKIIKDISASVRARLLNLSHTLKRNFQEITVRYAVERLLARLSLSAYAGQFILKGAMLYIPWKLDDTRTTMDLDLLGLGNPAMEYLKKVFEDIADTKIENDGIVFDKTSIYVTQIREESVYDGVRVTMLVYLGSMKIPLQIDIGYGDDVVPTPQMTEFPPLLAQQGPFIKSYSPETVIAEKFNAMTVLGMANSRMKDYYDIWMLSRKFSFTSLVLKDAIIQTFSKRKGEIPLNEPVALTQDFIENDSKQSQWKGFVRKQQRMTDAPNLSEVVTVIRKFLVPVLSDIHTGSSEMKIWDSNFRWRKSE